MTAQLPVQRAPDGLANPRTRSAATTAALVAASVRELIALHQKTAEHHAACIDTYEAILLALCAELYCGAPAPATPRQYDLRTLGLTTD